MYLSTAWLINLARNTLMAVLLYLAAPLVAENIYGKAELLGLLRLCCWLFVLDGLGSVGLTALQKELKLRPVAIVRLGGNIVGTVTAIGFSLWLKNATGIILGEIAAAATVCVAGYMVHPFRPSLRTNRRVTAELIGYGMMVYITGIVGAVGIRLDVLLLGGCASDHEVGIYGLAMTLVMAMVAMFSSLTVEVGFPALSMIQHDLPAVRNATAKIIQLTIAISGPIFLITALLAENIVKLLPDKYAEVATTLQLLSIMGFLSVFTRQMSPALYAINRVYWCAVWGAVRAISLGLLIVPMYRRWGLAGACWAANIGAITSAVVLWLALLGELRWPLRQWFADISIYSKIAAYLKK